MGIEYRLRFAFPDRAAVAEVLRRQPDVRETAPADRFDFGDAGHGWPQATAQVEAGGVYFCDHCGGGGQAVLHAVVAALISVFGPVAVEEL